MEPWTQRYRLRWRPTLAFYEKRYAVLRALEKDGLLRQFKSNEASVSARLTDASHVVTFGPNRLDISLLRPGTDDLLEQITARVLEALRPERLSRPSVGLQWLAPADQDYESARTNAATRLFPPENTVEFDDFAVLLDGHHEIGSYRLEIGIVEAAELPVRLAREVGRVGASDPETPRSLWPIDSFPDVAYFGDAEWDLDQTPDPTSAGVIELWSRTRDATSNVVSSVFEELGADTE